MARKITGGRISIQELNWTFFFFVSFVLAPILDISHYLMTLFIVFVSVVYSNRGVMRFTKKTKAMLGYFGLFFLYAILSAVWSSESVLDHKNIIITFLEGFVVIACAMNYITNRRRLISFIRSFIYAMTAFAILYYLSSPISTWGSEGMGRWLDVWRNSAAYYFGFAAICALYLYLSRINRQKIMLWLGLLLTIAALGTGSRKVFLQFVVAMVMYFVLQPGFRKRMKSFFKGFVVVAAALIIGMQIPAIRNIYEGRLLAVFAGLQSSDSSTVVRAMMRQDAMELFMQHPIFGIGLDGFKYWIATQSGFLSRWAMSATYSHCNYTELLCNGGLIGFGLFYAYPVAQIVKNIKRRNDVFVRLGIIIVVTFIVLDYGTVSYYIKMCLYILMLGLACMQTAEN